MPDKINISTVMLLRDSLKIIRLQLEDDVKVDASDFRHMHELADEAEDLMLAIRDIVPDPADEYSNASQGGP